MSEPFLGEIRQFGFSFNPRGWAKCDGQLLPISENSALFSLLGTTYGGDGRTTFGLPDLRGRAGIHQGQGPGLPDYKLGAKSGAVQTTLTVANLPPHNHTAVANAAKANADQTAPIGRSLAIGPGNMYSDTAPAIAMADNTVTVNNTGNGQALNNLPPYIVVNWCIALVGTFPSRS